jgi:uncharacterized protein YprB with RNaseH-like and TPR domain
MTHPPLLESTFIHAQGIGRTTELRLWQEGATDWQRYLLGAETEWSLTPTQCAALTPTIEESVQRLEKEDFAWFAEKLAPADHWRAVPSFGHRLAFVDIETTGGMEPEDLTLIGVFDGYRMRQYIKGQNLEQFPEALEDAAVLVTFFGTGFDLPFIRRTFPKLALPQMHVDLCYLFRKLGYRGGLKKIEAQLGIGRTESTTGLSGMDAVRLWFEYKKGKQSSLETLLTYNEEDVRNMTELLSIGYQKMATYLRTGDDLLAAKMR